MTIATLQNIILKVRNLTGSGNALQLTDASITNYVNSFYLYDFPAQFRSLKLKDKYTFNTITGIDTYAFDSEHYTTIEQPVYCMKREIKLFYEPWSFYGVNYNWQYQTNFDYGDGTTGPYSGFTTATPILRSVNNNPANTTSTSPSQIPYPVSRVQNILITTNESLGNTLNVTDDGNGNLIGDCTAGTINYNTGQISGLIFTSTVPSGNQVQIQYNPVQLNIPLSILFFQNQFVLRPVPDIGYTIELIAYRQPSQALFSTGAQQGVTELSEWWETLAFGAAKKVFQDRLDTDGMQIMDRFLSDAYSLNASRTYAELGKQSIKTIYSDQLTQNYGSSGLGFGGVGN